MTKRERETQASLIRLLSNYADEVEPYETGARGSLMEGLLVTILPTDLGLDVSAGDSESHCCFGSHRAQTIAEAREAICAIMEEHGL